MVTKKKLLMMGIKKSSLAERCLGIQACTGNSFVHDMKEPNDLDAKVNAMIMAIGSSPGKRENKIGRPSLSSSIDSSLRKNNMTRNDVYFTDVVKCRLTTINSKTGRRTDRSPTRDEIEACFPLLESEIEFLKPDAIVAMGQIAINALTSEPTINSALDNASLNYRGIPIFPTYHPRALDIEQDLLTKRKMRRIQSEAFESANNQ